ncbi:hypothetical protein [Serratia oryzae]|uniref:Uncharacterized protein n=1 Tax=Serratia oryzae TaxID=2034155 RepID=A0A1S8CNB1_9GAMM|nr:hypothetical protein [Serratia oryzae]OMQ24738.1 hypothetical protein BMI79_07920 [Serratia oryzae]
MAKDFMADAKTCLLKASEHVDSKDDLRLKYAALELRMCIESIVYHRLSKLVAKGKIDNSAYFSWQPPQVIKYFLSLDPYSLTDVEISIAKNNADNKPGKWVKFGTETRLNEKFIKKNYHKLGGYLHQITLSELQKGDKVISKMKLDIEKIISQIKTVMSSSLRNVNIIRTGVFNCSECKKDIVVLTPINEIINIKGGEVAHEIECPHKNSDTSCKASYKIITKKNEKTTYNPLEYRYTCQSTDCGGKINFWKSEVKPNAEKACSICGKIYMLNLYLTSCD